MAADRDLSAVLTGAAAARVEAWRAALGADSGTAGPDLVEGARSDVEGFAFARRLLEAVLAEGDPFAAALGLRATAQELPESLPARDRLVVRAGSIASLGLPWAVLPVARRWLRERLAHLVLAAKLPEDPADKAPTEPAAALREHAEAGFATLLVPGGDAVLGPAGVAREVARLTVLAGRPGVTHLAVDPERIAPVGLAGDWGLDDDAARAVSALTPVLDAARAHGVTVLLEPRSYRGALLAAEVLARLLGAVDPVLRLGAVLPAELPESWPSAQRLIRLSAERVAAGGEALELVVGVAGVAAAERIASLETGLAVPVLDDDAAVRAQVLRLVRLLFDRPEVRPVLAAEDPLLLAVATILAEQRPAGAPALVLQLRAGVAPQFAAVLADHGFAVRLRLPLAPPREFAGVVDELVRLAAEAADPGSSITRAAALLASGAGGRVVEADRDALRRALDRATQPAPASHRTQLRSREWNPGERDSALFYRPPADPERFDTGGLTAAVLGLDLDATGQIVARASGPAQRLPVISVSGFANEPDTDASRPENRAWARELLRRAAVGRAGPGAASDETVPIPGLVRGTRRRPGADERREAILAVALTAAEAWGAPRAAERATRVARLALGTASARDRLTEVRAAESGAPIAVIDAEVTGAVDAARYLGQSAAGLGAVRGAEFRPDRLALVVADAGAPLDERAEAMLAALAAGSVVLLAAHPSVMRSSAALIEEWRAAGLPEGAVVLLEPALDAGSPAGVAEPGEPAPAPHVALAAEFAADPRIDRALVLGRRETARTLIRRRPDLRVEARLRVLGSTLIAPGADRSAAVRGAVRSAFGAGAGDPRTARALVLLGTAGRSKRLRRELADAVRALRVGDTAEPGGADPLAVDLGPLPAQPDAAGLRALTELDRGEEWLVRPERLDAEGRLWRPGVRLGVARDARFWADAVGVPVLGVITAGTVREAVELQSSLGGGSVAGLYAGDEHEILPWLDRVRAASLALGRPTTGGRVERQPGGGWGAAGMGSGLLAGGPNRLVTLGSWRLREGTPSSTLHLRGLAPEVRVLIELAQPSLDYASFDRVRRAALADALSWRTSLGRLSDDIGLGSERNLLRHRPVGAHVRLAEGGDLAELVRVLAAGLLVGAPMTVSTGAVLPAELSRFLAEAGIAVSLERDADWLERIAAAAAPAADGGRAGGVGAGVAADAGSRGAGSGFAPDERVRLIGGDRVRVAEWLGGQDRVALWAEPVTMAGPVELLAFLREQAVSIAAHRHGLATLPAGVAEWIAEVDARATR